MLPDGPRAGLGPSSLGPALALLGGQHPWALAVKSFWSPVGAVALLPRPLNNRGDGSLQAGRAVAHCWQVSGVHPSRAGNAQHGPLDFHGAENSECRVDGPQQLLGVLHWHGSLVKVRGQ